MTVPFDSVLEHFGGQSQLAERLGISVQAVSQWKGEIPPERAIEIEQISDGHFRASDLPIRKRKSAA